MNMGHGGPAIICKLHKGHYGEHLAVIYWKNEKDIFHQLGESDNTVEVDGS